MRKLIYIIALFTYGAFAQHHSTGNEPKTLLEIFKNSHVHGHVRNFFMNTMNEGELKDYYTNALGGAIAIKTAEYKGFEVGIKGIFTYKTFSADLNAPDPITGQVSKWEHELYDINDLDNFDDLDRLEQLYLRYNFKNGYATYGKMEIEDTPLLNESDGRMKPFAFKGVWFNYQIKDHHFNLSWLDRVSPRSTVEWYSFQEALGLTNNGFQPNGEVAEYAEHLESEGIAMLQYETVYKDIDIQANHWYLHRVMNTSMLLVDWHKNNFHLGLQYALQFPDGAQEELEYDNRYLQPGERGQVFSTKAGLHKPHWKFNIAYTHAFDSGRFLFPRELGRDHFYTSISRSRLEGFGDIDVLTLSGGSDLDLDRFWFGAEFTRVFGARVGDFEFNKYNLDEYYQLNAHLHYEFNGFFEGLKLDLLYVYKQNVNNDTPENIFNVSNFNQLNFVVNYDF